MTLKESGLYYPNNIAHNYVTAMEETIGTEAMQTVFKVAGIPENLYPVPKNHAKEFDFIYFGAIGAALSQMYGFHAERGLSIHAGHAAFTLGLREYGPLTGSSDLVLKAIPVKAKVKLGLMALVETFNKFTDQKCKVSESADFFMYTIYTCPICWGRNSDKHICYGGTGIIEAGIHWASGGLSFAVEEVACQAVGDENCVFHITKKPLD